MRIADLRKPARELIHGVHSDGWRLGLQTLYAPWLPGWLRDAGGAWHNASRMWVFPRTAINGTFARRLADEAPSGVAFTVATTVDLIKHALAHPEPDLFADGLDVQIYPVSGGGYVLQYKRDTLLDRVITQHPSCRQLKNRSGWFLDMHLDALLERLRQQAGIDRSFLYLHDTDIILVDTAGGDAPGDLPRLGVDGAQLERTSGRDVETSADVLSVATSPLKRLPIDPATRTRMQEGYGLYDYQVEGVAHFLGLSSALNADDMGLGKSRQAATAADLVRGDGAVLVVCPASLKINWEREIHLIIPGATVAFAGQTADWEKAEWIIANYERLGSVVQAVHDRQVAFTVMLVDEAHYLKEPSSGRTRNAFLLAKQISRRYLLTATPVLNREVEIHTLLRLSGHPIGDLPVSDFTERFSGSAEGRRLLKQRLDEWMIRRPKKVVKGLKGKSHQLQYVQLGEEDREHYRRLAADPGMPALVKVGALRQALEKAKAAWLIDTIQGMAADDKVLVFSEHLEIVSVLHDELAAAGIVSVTYTGKMSPTKRQAAVDTFQNDPDVRVFIGLRKAAGVGLGLTAANYVIPVSLPWNGALRRQAEDRAYRNGQTRHVTVLIPIVPGTIDEKVLALNRHKETIESDVLDGDDRPPNPLDMLEPVESEACLRKLSGTCSRPCRRCG